MRQPPGRQKGRRVACMAPQLPAKVKSPFTLQEIFEKKGTQTNGCEKNLATDNIFTIQLSKHGNGLMMVKCVTNEQFSGVFDPD